MINGPAYYQYTEYHKKYIYIRSDSFNIYVSGLPDDTMRASCKPQKPQKLFAKTIKDWKKTSTSFQNGLTKTGLHSMTKNSSLFSGRPDRNYSLMSKRRIFKAREQRQTSRCHFRWKALLGWSDQQCNKELIRFKCFTPVKVCKNLLELLFCLFPDPSIFEKETPTGYTIGKYVNFEDVARLNWLPSDESTVWNQLGWLHLYERRSSSTSTTIRSIDWAWGYWLPATSSVNCI